VTENTETTEQFEEGLVLRVCGVSTLASRVVYSSPSDLDPSGILSRLVDHDDAGYWSLRNQTT
jgi:hypothetical protein